MIARDIQSSIDYVYNVSAIYMSIYNRYFRGFICFTTVSQKNNHDHFFLVFMYLST